MSSLRSHLPKKENLICLLRLSQNKIHDHMVIEGTQLHTGGAIDSRQCSTQWYQCCVEKVLSHISAFWVYQECTSSLPGPFLRQLGPTSEIMIHQVWGGAQKCAFLTNSLVMLRFLVQESYFENRFINTIPHEQRYSNFVVYLKAN